MQSRMTVRGIAMATGVVAASGALTITTTSFASELAVATDPAVTRMGDLPRGGAVRGGGVHRIGPPAGRKPALIKAQQRRTAERAARQAREARDRGARATRSRAVSPSGGDLRAVAATMAAQRYDWRAEQLSCLDSLWTRESGWDPYATNPTSGAYGIPQALPGSRMSTFGAGWRTDAATQIEWGLAYIRDSHSTPCGAWATFQAKGWY